MWLDLCALDCEINMLEIGSEDLDEDLVCYSSP